MALTTYNPSDLFVAYAVEAVARFVFVSPDFAPGTFLTIEQDSDAWDTVTGVNGKIIRVESKNTSGLITLSLFNGSPTSDFLAAVSQIDKLSNRGKGRLTVSLKRTETINGELDFSKKQRPFVVADGCWVKSVPRIAFGEEAPVIEWVLQTENLKVLPMYLDHASDYIYLPK